MKTYLSCKRFLDLVAATSLLLLFSPLTIIVAVGIKFSSKGPLFFCQQRVGHRCRSFQIIKFRTMHVDLKRPTAQTSNGETESLHLVDC